MHKPKQLYSVSLGPIGADLSNLHGGGQAFLPRHFCHLIFLSFTSKFFRLFLCPHTFWWLYLLTQLEGLQAPQPDVDSRSDTLLLHQQVPSHLVTAEVQYTIKN